MTASMSREAIVTWLLGGDPAVGWQTLRDLADGSDSEVAAARARVATEGWGADLLARQDPDGRWAGALYSPKWTSTTYTLLLLHWLGLEPGHPQAVAGCRCLWDGAREYGGGLNLATTVRQPETCITGMLILLAASFGLEDERIDPTVEWLLGQQLDDGGWNCETIRNGSHHGSFHTTITALDALLVYQQAGGGVPVADALTDGRWFFVDHALYRSHRTGEVANPAFTRFPFPPQWHFDVLCGLDHFRAAGVPADDRLVDAVDVVHGACRPDGRWPMHRPYPGRQWFRLEEPGPSRWATLRALRVLDWWDATASL